MGKAIDTSAAEEQAIPVVAVAADECCTRAALSLPGRALAELVMAAVSRGVQTAANSQLAALAWQRPARLWLSKASAAAGEQLAPARLPPPMVAGNYEADVSSCHLQVCVDSAGPTAAGG